MNAILRMVGGEMDGWTMTVAATADAVLPDGLWFAIPDISGDLVRHHYAWDTSRREHGRDVIEYLYDSEGEA